MKSNLRTILLILLLSAVCVVSKGQNVAIKTNALFLAASTPDLGVELITGEHTSLALSVFGNYKPYTLNCKLIALQPEFRYWFNGRPLTREYIGCSVAGVMYDTGISKHVYRGNALSAGITGGYVWSLGKRWSFELSAGFGFLFFKQKQYYKGDNYDDSFVGELTQSNNWGYKLFPSKLGATFIYIIK